MTVDMQARAEIERLWGPIETTKPGPKGAHTARSIAAAAIGIADEGGLDAVSMRSVSTAVGMSPMGLYTYFPGKPELIEVMIDEAYRSLPLSYEGCHGWRSKLWCVARENWALVMRHPWVAEVDGHRPVLGPNVIAKYNFELGSIEGTGLSDITIDLVLTTVLAFVRGAVRGKLDAVRTTNRTRQTDAEWWQARSPLLAEVLKDRYPLAQRVGAAAGAFHDAATDPDASFKFGMERLLDGIAHVLGPSLAE